MMMIVNNNDFKRMIDLLQKHDTRHSALLDNGVDLMDYDNFLMDTIHILLKCVFGKGGYDIITWWLWENGHNIWENDGTKIKMDTVNDLYNYLVKYNG